jgi:hypothetical protein
MIIGGVVPTHLIAQFAAVTYTGPVEHPVFSSNAVAARQFGGQPDRWWNPSAGLLGSGSQTYGWGYGRGYPNVYADMGLLAAYRQSSPHVFFETSAETPVEPPTPPPPASTVSPEYMWPDKGGDPKATFSIVSRNGSVRHAIAVWVEGSDVKYSAADGSAGRLELATLDCGATSRLNAQQSLTLPLPGCALPK